MSNPFEGAGQPAKREGYSADFAERVKAEFPNHTGLHEALDAGSPMVGRYLDGARAFNMKPEDIVTAIESGNQVKLLEEAKKAARLNALYVEWGNTQDKAAQ